MKLNEFKELVKDSVQLNIVNRVDEINLNDYIKEPISFNKSPKMIRVAVSAFAFVLVLLLSFYIYLSNKTYVTMTLDINPSIEVNLNYFNKVIKVEGLNQDGIEFVEELDYKNKELYDFLDEVYELGIDKEYFNITDAYMLVGVYSNKEAKQNDISSILNEMSDIKILSFFQASENTGSVFNNLLLSVEKGSSDIDYSDPLFPEDSIVNSDLDDNDYFINQEDFQYLAYTNSITSTHMFLIVQVFNLVDDYKTEDDLQTLIDMDIQDLIILYESNIN